MVSVYNGWNRSNVEGCARLLETIRWSLAMYRSLLTAALLIGLLSWPSAIFASSNYSNKRFTYSVSLPPHARLCGGGTEKMDHGFTMLLDRRSQLVCPPSDHTRQVEFFAFDNALEATRSLAQLSDWTCNNVLNGRCGPAPNGLGLFGRLSVARKVHRSDGWVGVAVVAQARAPAVTKAAPGDRGFNFIAILRTDQGHLGQDMIVFRHVLNTATLTGR